MRYFCVILIFVAGITACNTIEPKTVSEPADTSAVKPGLQVDTISKVNQSNAVAEEKVLDSLRNISFVKKSEHYLDSLTNHKRGMAFIFDTVSNNELTVRAGYNGNPTHFETYYIFTVNPQTFDIKILETVSGDNLTISEYEKMQQ